jgi:hypothetical protein
MLGPGRSEPPAGASTFPARFCIVSIAALYLRRGLGAMSAMDLNDPEYWQKLAEEARAVAVQMLDARTKAIMLGIAQVYEKLAQSVEQGGGKPL